MPNLQVSIANQIATSAAQTTLSVQELITTMKTSGMADSAIKQALMSDLNSGGPLFGSFRNKLKNTVRNGVELSSNGSSNSAFTKAGVQEFQWISVGDGKVCPDCEERHGETGTMEYFETIGLPASGFSVCTTNCRCQLLPQTYKGENLDKPLVKGKKAVKESVVRRSKQSRVRTVNQLMTDGYTERQAKLIFRNVEEMMDMKSPDVSNVLGNMDKYERLNGAKKSIWRVVPKNGRIESGDFVFDSLKGAETFRKDFGFIRGQPDIVRLKVNASDLLKPKAKNLISKDYGQELIYLPKSIGLK